MLKHLVSVVILTATLSVAAQQPPAAPSLGERAVATVLHQDIINPQQHIDGTKAPLSTRGKWSIATAPAEGCAPSTSCIKTLYTVTDANIICTWTVQLSNTDTAEGIIVDEDENAEKYLLHILKPDEATALVSSSVQASYPPIAKAAHVTGEVEVRWVVQKDGKPEIQKISGPPMMIGSVKDAAEKWIFKPFLMHGRPIAWTNSLIFNFDFGDRVTSHFATKKQ